MPVLIVDFKLPTANLVSQRLVGLVILVLLTYEDVIYVSLKKRFQRSLVTQFLNPPPMTSMSGRCRHRWRTDKRTWHVGRRGAKQRAREGGSTLFLFNARYDMARCLFRDGRNNTAACGLRSHSWKLELGGKKGTEHKDGGSSRFFAQIPTALPPTAVLAWKVSENV